MAKTKITYIDEIGAEHDLNENKTEVKPEKIKKSSNALFIIIIIFLALIMGSVGAIGTLILLSSNNNLIQKLGLNKLAIDLPIEKTQKIKLEESSAVIDSAEKVMPSVVSISTKSNITDYFGQSYEQEGGGTGFIITSDGMIATNKHVVSDENATYTVFTSDGKDYSAKILATDPYNDLAILKIDANGLPTVELGDSNETKIGQWVIAIGNALGEFNNTVTAGVISAKERQITASGSGLSEVLDGLLQTDAAINPGNSGGPLVNLSGQVIGINTAVAGGAQGIGFAIPINSVTKAIDSIKKTGKIERPMLGVRYLPITKEIAKLNQLDVDYGVWVLPGDARGEVGVIPGSPEDQAWIVDHDILLKINDQWIDQNNSLTKILSAYDIGDEVSVKLLHKGDEKTVKVKLSEVKN